MQDINLTKIISIIWFMAIILWTLFSVDKGESTMDTAFAEKSKEMVFGDDYVPQSLVNYGCDFNEDASEKSQTLLSEKADYDIIDMVVSNENIVIESNGGSEFVDVFGKLEDGSYVNITNDVSCKFDDGSIATWIYGRILADAKGKTTMTLTYNGVSKNISVTVEKQIDIEKFLKEQNNKMMKSSQSNTRLYGYPEQYRFDAIEIASDIVNVKWTPECDLQGWDGYIFKAGIPVTGMPYTQKGVQTNKSDFLYYLANAANFYYGTTQPNYGCDCSGLVSLAWQLPQHTWTGALMQGIYDGIYSKVGSYNTYNPTYNELYSSYSSLQMADAVVSTKMGHTFLIYGISCSDDVAYVYEQTPPKARYNITYWTFNQMANGKYVPFSKQ